MSKKILLIALAIMTTFLVLVIFWNFRIVIIYVFISLTLAAVMRPLSTLLTGKRLLWRIFWVITYIVAALGFGYAIFLVGRFAMVEIQSITVELSVKDVWTFPAWLEGTAFQKTLLNWLPAPNDLFHAFTGEEGQLILPALLGAVKNVGEVITAAVIILILSVYWSINQIHFERLWLSLLPSGQRKQARGIWRTVELELGAYVRNQFFFSLIAGILLGIGYWLLGSPYPIIMALIGALLCLIPVIGAPMAILPPILIGLLTSAQLSLFTTIYALVVLIVLVLWIKPILFKLKWDNPLPTIIFLLALADAFGIIGMIIAPPLSAICQILWSRLVTHRRPAGAAAQISDLKERRDQLYEKIQEMGEDVLPLISSSMERLTELINTAEPLLHGLPPVEPASSGEDEHTH